MLNFKIFEKSSVNVINDKLLYFIKFSIFILAIVFFNSQISIAGELSKSHKDSLNQECKNLTKNNEYKSVNQCKRLRTSAIKQEGILINFADHEDEDGSFARIGCSGQIKNGIFVYNECLANLLGVNIVPDPPPRVEENDGSGEKLEENEKNIEIINVADNVYNKVVPSSYLVCLLDDPMGDTCQACGSAVVIKNQTLATNCHVVYKTNLETYDISNIPWEIIDIINVKDDFKIPKNWKRAKIIKSDIKNDRCIIQSLSINSSPVNIKSFDDIKMLENVFAIGSPQCQPGVMTPGEIQNKYQHGFGDFTIPVLQTNAHIRGGSSGGGLFDEEANLLGITTLGEIKESTNPFNMALSADEFLKLIKE